MVSYDKALEIKPDYGYALGGVADCALKVCDWAERAKRAGELTRHVIEGRLIIYPLCDRRQDRAAV